MATALCVHSNESNKPLRLGLLGGTFDPIHRGHVELAKLAMAQASLDRVVLVPCHLPPHRGGLQAGAEDRLAMARLAVENELALDVSDFEIRKSSTSYTVETLEHYRQQFSSAELFFCLGGDSLAQFVTWHRWQQILELANLIVLTRDQQDFSKLDVGLKQRLVSSVDELTDHNGQILQLQAPELDVSATAIRAALVEGANDGKDGAYLNQWLSQNVLKYIKEHRVYE